jgi:hypothetical protein
MTEGNEKFIKMNTVAIETNNTRSGFHKVYLESHDRTTGELIEHAKKLFIETYEQ